VRDGARRGGLQRVAWTCGHAAAGCQASGCQDRTTRMQCRGGDRVGADGEHQELEQPQVPVGPDPPVAVPERRAGGGAQLVVLRQGEEGQRLGLEPLQEAGGDAVVDRLEEAEPAAGAGHGAGGARRRQVHDRDGSCSRHDGRLDGKVGAGGRRKGSHGSVNLGRESGLAS
jgi:hypothetical protein